MKKILAFLIAVGVSLSANAAETITIVSGYNAAATVHNAMYKIIDIANKSQNRYNFILDFKPGAGGVVALNYISQNPTTRVALLSTGIIQEFDEKRVIESDFTPIYAVGDACWGVATNLPADESKGIKSIRNPKGNDIVIGAVGSGSVSHIIGLESAEAAHLKPIVLLFKSPSDAMINQAGNQGVNLNLETVEAIKNVQTRNKDIKIVGITCGQRHPLVPKIPTLAEQGMKNIPSVFNIVYAPTQMYATRQTDIGRILDQATLQLGDKEMFELSGFKSPVFSKNPVSAQQFYDVRAAQLRTLTKKYANQITKN